MLLLAALLVGCGESPPQPAAALAAVGDAGFIDGLQRRGSDAVPQLRSIAEKHDQMAVRGEAVLALADIRGPEADRALQTLSEDTSGADLIRTWAAAARIQRAEGLDQVIALSPLVQQFPALKRPVKMKIEALPKGDFSVTDGLTLIQSDPSLQGMLMPLMQQQPASSVVEAMLRHPNDNARRTAAGMLAGMDSNASRRAIVDGFAFQAGAEQVPWQGGALWIPSSRWDRGEAEAIVGSLISWHLFCTQNGDTTSRQQIDNNLRSVGLTQQAGAGRGLYGDTDALLLLWGQSKGRGAVEAILRDHGLTRDAHYMRILNQIGGK